MGDTSLTQQQPTQMPPSVQTVRIFLASSAELADHRSKFALFIAEQNKLWLAQRGVFFELVQWEDFLDAMSATRLQDEYNRALQGCDLFVLLFRTKVGRYTAEEFAEAFGQFKDTGRPLIWTYFHRASVDLNDIDEEEFAGLRRFQKQLKALGHFETKYDNHDALCRHFHAQLDKLKADGFFTPPPATLEAAPATGSTIPAQAQQERVLTHLQALIARLDQHEHRYVPLSGEETQEQRLERVLKELVVPSDVVYQAFGFDKDNDDDADDDAPADRRHAHAPADADISNNRKKQPSKVYADVLDAYRALPQRRRAGAPGNSSNSNNGRSSQPHAVRRLAVLGEPGAGKSFSLGRIACELAHAALADPAQPVPVLVALGLWTDPAEPLEAFIARCSLPPPPRAQAGSKQSADTRAALLPEDIDSLRRAGRLLLLLDAVNEIPPGQRRNKSAAIAALAQDDHLAALVLSCRQRDFEAELQGRLPFDTLRLQPLQPWQVRDFLHRTLTLVHGPEEGARQAEDKFWQIAGGEALREVWQVWEQAGAGFELFWTAEEEPTEPDIRSAVSRKQYHYWLAARSLEGRSLILLAENPFLLTVMMQLPAIPPNRARLFAGFLKLLHQREADARQHRGDGASVPYRRAWRAVLVQVAEALQRADASMGGVRGEDDGARTALARRDWPVALSDELLAFCLDASVLQRVGDELRFTHQLLQESLAADVLRDAARSGQRPASDFWPEQLGWHRTGWEVVAEIAAEACAGDAAEQITLIDWLARTAPKVAADIWQHAGRPALPAELLTRTQAQWLPRMTDVQAEPAPEFRMAIGAWLGALDLDDRPGTGLRADGLPDIAWVQIADDRPFIYQNGEQHPPLPPYAIARYPVTNRQWQAFVDDGGYTDERWWAGLAGHSGPGEPSWTEPTAPRETVSWFEATAYCRWLGERLGLDIRLPTEQQ
jgi:hypothetical protein